MRLPRSVETADVAGQARPRPRRPERPARGRAGGRRHADPRRAADAASCCSSAGPRRSPSARISGGRRATTRALRDRAGRRAAARARSPTTGIRVLENTRFDPGETANDPRLARELADGWTSTSTTRSAPRTARTPRPRRSRTCCRRMPGLLLLAELEHLGRLLGDVERPFVLVTGGAKVEDKLGVLRNLGGRADTVLVGGKMAEELRDEQPAAVSGRAAERRRRRGGVRGGGRGAGRAVRRPAGRVARARHRPDDAGAVRRADPRGARRCSGTARWASSSGALRRRHEGGRRGRRRRSTATRSWAAATRCARVQEPAGRPRLLGLHRRRRVARAARGQGAPRRGSDSGRVGTTSPSVLVAGNWKMFKGPEETRSVSRRVRAARRRRRRRVPAVRLARPRRSGAGRRSTRRTSTGTPRARTRGRSRPAMLRRARRRRRDRRPLGAPAALRRDRRDGRATRCEAALAAGLGVIACVGETEAARGGRDGGGAAATGRGDPVPRDGS